MKKMYLRPSMKGLFSGQHSLALQGIGRGFSNLVVQTPHAAPEGESVIPSMNVINAMEQLDQDLAQNAEDLATARQELEAAATELEETKATYDGKFEDYDEAIENATNTVEDLKTSVTDLETAIENIDADSGIIFSPTLPGEEFERDSVLWIQTSRINHSGNAQLSGRLTFAGTSTGYDVNAVSNPRFNGIPSGSFTTWDSDSWDMSVVAGNRMSLVPNSFATDPGILVEANSTAASETRIRLTNIPADPGLLQSVSNVSVTVSSSREVSARFKSGETWVEVGPYPPGENVFVAKGITGFTGEIEVWTTASLSSFTVGRPLFYVLATVDRFSPLSYFDYTYGELPSGSRWRWDVAGEVWVPVSDSEALRAVETAGLAMDTANLADAAAKGMVVAAITEPQGAEGRVWMQLDNTGSLIGLKQWSTDQNDWVAYRIIADEIMVPSSLGTVTIRDGAITGSKVEADSVAAEVGVFIDAMMENLSVAGVAAMKEAVVDELFVRMAVVDKLQVMDEIITRDMIATGSVTGEKMTFDQAAINKLVAQEASFGEVIAKKVTAWELEGGTVTGALVRTAESGARTELTSQGLRTVNAAGQDLVRVGYGISTGMEVRNPSSGDLVPLAQLVFGHEVIERDHGTPGAVVNPRTTRQLDWTGQTFTARSNRVLIMWQFQGGPSKTLPDGTISNVIWLNHATNSVQAMVRSTGVYGAMGGMSSTFTFIGVADVVRGRVYTPSSRWYLSAGVAGGSYGYFIDRSETLMIMHI